MLVLQEEEIVKWDHSLERGVFILKQKKQKCNITIEGAELIFEIGKVKEDFNENFLNDFLIDAIEDKKLKIMENFNND